MRVRRSLRVYKAVIDAADIEGMRIEGPRPTPPSSSAKRPESAGGGFAVPQAGSTGRAAAAAPAHSTPSLDALMALQGDVMDAPARRRRQVARAETTLNALDGLIMALVDGRDTGTVRATLSAGVSGREETGDEDLDGLLLDIDVRAAVELAKLERRAATAV